MGARRIIHPEGFEAMNYLNKRVFVIILAALSISFSLASVFVSAETLEIKQSPVADVKKSAAAPDGKIVSIKILDKNEKFNEWEVTYMSGGLKVKGFIYEPAGAGDGADHPGIIFNHGGVGGVPTPTKERCRELAEMGYVVIAPSYRGEDGSEGEIEVADGEVDDAMNAMTALKSVKSVDPKRIAMVGTSHGGIITLIAIERDHSLAAAVCAYGVTNTYTWYKYLVDNGFDVSDELSVKVYGKGPEDKPEAFRKRAPALDAEKITTPLMLIYGEKDNIVPPSQAKEMAEALDKHNIPYEMHIIPDVGHGLLFFKDPARRSETEIARTAEAWGKVLDFLKKNLETKQ